MDVGVCFLVVRREGLVVNELLEGGGCSYMDAKRTRQGTYTLGRMVITLGRKTTMSGIMAATLGAATLLSPHTVSSTSISHCMSPHTANTTSTLRYLSPSKIAAIIVSRYFSPQTGIKSSLSFAEYWRCGGKDGAATKVRGGGDFLRAFLPVCVNFCLARRLFFVKISQINNFYPPRLANKPKYSTFVAVLKRGKAVRP